MVTIGENLKYKRNEVVAIGESTIELQESPYETREIVIAELKQIEIAAIKSATGFTGSMEWGMRNPTFVLPTIVWNNVISLFKRRNDTFHYLVTLSDDTKIIIYSNNSKFNHRLKQLANKKPGSVTS